MTKRSVWIAAGAFTGILLVVLSAWVGLRRVGAGSVATPTDAVFEIAKGESLGRVATRLQEQGIIPSRLGFLALTYWRRDDARVKFGEYLIRAGLSVEELLDMFVAGKVRQHAFAIIEGWNVRQVLGALREHPAVAHDLSGKRPEEIMGLLGFAAGLAEGRFFPDTYFFPKGFADTVLLRRAAERMEALLDREWQQRAPGLPLQTPYEALILASLVEKETARAEERPRIAGVFIRRLEQKMRLQTDPTVIYGLGERYAGNLSRHDLRQDTPYNTYTRSGLPPSPIAMPGAGSLHAALHPEPGTSLYFVARGDGTHEFSSTLPEHERAVDRYQRNQRE